MHWKLCGSYDKVSFDGNTFICFKIRGFTIKEQHTLPCALRLGKNSSEKNTSRCSALWVLKMPPHSSRPFIIPLPFFHGGLTGVFTLRLRILITPTKIKSWYKMTVNIWPLLYNTIAKGWSLVLTLNENWSCQPLRQEQEILMKCVSKWEAK